MARRLSQRRTGQGTLSPRPPYAQILAENGVATADYIADMAGSMARMAGDARLYGLTHLLNLVRLEAADLSRKLRPPGQGSDTRLPP